MNDIIPVIMLERLRGRGRRKTALEPLKRPAGDRRTGCFSVTGPNPGQEHEHDLSFTSGAQGAFADGAAI